MASGVNVLSVILSATTLFIIKKQDFNKVLYNKRGCFFFYYRNENRLQLQNIVLML